MIKRIASFRSKPSISQGDAHDILDGSSVLTGSDNFWRESNACTTFYDPICILYFYIRVRGNSLTNNGTLCPELSVDRWLNHQGWQVRELRDSVKTSKRVCITKLEYRTYRTMVRLFSWITCAITYLVITINKNYPICLLLNELKTIVNSFN